MDHAHHSTKLPFDISFSERILEKTAQIIAEADSWLAQTLHQMESDLERGPSPDLLEGRGDPDDTFHYVVQTRPLPCSTEYYWDVMRDHLIAFFGRHGAKAVITVEDGSFKMVVPLIHPRCDLTKELDYLQLFSMPPHVDLPAHPSDPTSSNDSGSDSQWDNVSNVSNPPDAQQAIVQPLGCCDSSTVPKHSPPSRSPSLPPCSCADTAAPAAAPRSLIPSVSVPAGHKVSVTVGPRMSVVVSKPYFTTSTSLDVHDSSGPLLSISIENDPAPSEPHSAPQTSTEPQDLHIVSHAKSTRLINTAPADVQSINIDSPSGYQVLVKAGSSPHVVVSKSKPTTILSRSAIGVLKVIGPPYSLFAIITSVVIILFIYAATAQTGNYPHDW